MKPFALGLFGLVCLSGGIGIGYLSASTTAEATSPPLAAQDRDYQQLALFAESLHKIRTQHLDPPDTSELIEHAIEGMVESLDPYSNYLPPELLRMLREDTAGAYKGVGIELVDSPDGPRILSVFPGSPAAQQKLQAGDLLLAVQGVSLQRASLERVVTEMRRPETTRVQLTIQRGEHVFDLELEKAAVVVDPVEHQLLAHDILWLRLRQFSEASSKEVYDTLKGADGQRSRSLILDLRDNPGGLLDEAIRIARLFMDEGTIVQVHDGTHRGTQRWNARPQDVVYRKEVVVLINAQSASAAEILAAALRDNDRARIVGQTSFGKGTVQAITPLMNGGALKLTITEYFGPLGHCIHQQGVTPDLLVEAEDLSERPSMATTCRAPAGIHPRQGTIAQRPTPRPEFASAVANDRPLAVAIELLSTDTDAR